MPRILKYLAIGVGGLLVLLLIVIGVIAATFDPNAYKPQIISLVQEKKQRTLAIPGDIKLTFFPKIGVDLGKLSVSEHKGTATFASVESARISLALLPLLRKEVVVDQIKIDGLTANLVRYKNGKTNVDDLLSQEKEEEKQSQAVKLDIDGVSITNTNIFFDDQMAGRKLEVTKVDLSTGKIANAKPSDFKLSAYIRNNNPKLATQVAVKSGFNLNLDQKHYVLNDLDAEVKGELAGFSNLAVKLQGDVDLKPDAKQFALEDVKLSASGQQAATAMEAQFTVPTLTVSGEKVKSGKIAGQAKITDAGKNVVMNFSAPSFDGTPQAFTIPSLGLDVAIKQGELNANAKLATTISGDLDKQLFTSREIRLDLDGKQGAAAIKGVLTTPLTANMKDQVIELPKIAADFTLPNPAGGTMVFKAGGNMNANLAKQTLASQLNAKLDQSTIDAKLGLAKFSPPAYTFDIAIDQIDLDRYSEKKPAASAEAGKPAKPPVAEQPIDLSALKELNAKGSIRIGAFKAANIRASNVRVDVHAAGGKLEVNPLNASLYQGSLAGAVTVNATNPPRFAVRQNLSGVSIGPLLKDAIGNEPIEGRGSVQLDVTTQGAVTPALKKGLNGSAKLDLRDGAVRGVNVAKLIRTAKAKLGGATQGQQTGTSSTEEKTDFSELTGSFRITNGVARNDDLSAKSPLLRIGGQGDINLVNETVDYTVKATVVSSLEGQGGAELQTLKGLTVPVKLSGPFTAIAWNVDFAGLATQVVKQKIDERKDEVKAKAVEKLQDRLKGLFGK